MNAFQRLINQTISLEILIANDVLALLLLGSLLNSWEMLVVTLGNVGPEGKHLSLARAKSACRMKTLTKKTRSLEPIRRPWSRKTIITGEEAGIGIPRTRTN